MPMGKKPWELASSSCGSSSLLSASPPWWRKQVGRGSGGFPLNKLALVCFLELEDSLVLDLCAGGHSGCGKGVEINGRSGIWLLGCTSSSSMRTKERHRPRISPEKSSRWAVFSKLRCLLISFGSSGRKAVFLVSSMTHMVEGRPFEALELAGSRLSSSSRLDAIREAVLLKLGVHVSRFWHLWMVEMASWRSGGPKWLVPGGGRSESLLKQCFGPDCVPVSRYRVLSAISRDLLVICFLLSPYLYLVLSLFNI